MIPEKIFDSSKKLSDLTTSYLDKSEYFTNLIKKEYNNNNVMVLGEFQLSFVLFLIGENLEAFEQFKKIFNLITNIEGYLLSHPEFSLSLLRAIYTSLSQFPKDFFFDELSSNSFIHHGLKSLFSMDFEGGSRDRCNKLRNMMKEKFSIEIRETYEVVGDQIVFDEDDDEAPVVVDADMKFINFDRD